MNSSNERSSLCVGRWRGCDVRIHILLPVVALSALLLLKDFDRSFMTAEGLGLLIVDARLVCLALGILLISVALHEIARVIAARRVGGHVSSFTLGPLGGLSRIHLPADPPAHLLTGLAGPCVTVILMGIAGCGLVVAGDRHVLQLLLNPFDPDIVYPVSGTRIFTLKLVAQLVLWVNWCLLLVDLLPVDPCSGAEILRGVLWPVVGRNTAAYATSHVALGGALLLGISSALLVGQSDPAAVFPAWFPLALAAIFLLYGGRNVSIPKSYDVGLAIDEFDSDDEIWVTGNWIEEDHATVLVEHIQDKQQEALDRKRQEREANEDARVDAILARLHGSSFENLSEEERAFLKRASRRYQRRRGSSGDKPLK